MPAGCVFALLPKTPTGMNDFKKSLLDNKPKHLIKLGSLGPYRLMHKQLEVFLQLAKIPYTSFDSAPLMNHIFIEQYDNQVLENYRGNATAPYVDPRALASAIEQSCLDPQHYYKNYDATGPTQYSIEDIANVLADKGFAVNKINHVGYDQTHDTLKDLAPDFQLMKTLGRAYIDDDWAPAVSEDLPAIFGAYSRSFADFVEQDRDIYTQSFNQDIWL
jgi:hypothetical protein